MKLFHNIYIAVLIFILSIGVFGFSLYHYCFSAVGNEEILKSIVIEPGSIDSIATTLDEEGFIRNKLAFKVYIKISGKTNLKAGEYSLSKDMDLFELVEILEKGNSSNGNEIQILFKEGLNMRQIAGVIVKNTNNTEDMVYEVLEDKKYLNSLITKYWFLSDKILNDDIYYSLEGYLYPSTYNFSSKDVSVKKIFETMLDEMEKQLTNYKDKINNNENSFHDLLTLASIAELEAVSLSDRKGIAGVLYNRLDKRMSLDCDVTTYYGLKINMGDVDDDDLDLKGCNNYNTRCATFKRLPVGPICNPSIDSIIAALEPTESKYLYFLADSTGKIHFSKTLNEHTNTKNRLIREGLWN